MTHPDYEHPLDDRRNRLRKYRYRNKYLSRVFYDFEWEFEQVMRQQPSFRGSIHEALMCYYLAKMGDSNRSATRWGIVALVAALFAIIFILVGVFA